MKPIIKKIYFLTTLLSCLSLTQPACAHRHHHQPSNVLIKGDIELAKRIRAAIALADPSASVGVIIRSMKSGDILYNQNSQRAFIPGSTMKVLTAEAALIFLGTDYTFPTRIVTDARTLSAGTLNGNVYLVESGDPSLTYYDMNDLMTGLKDQQVHGVNGNVYLDNSAYDQNGLGPGWLDSDLKYAYAAPINAGIINENIVSFEITPNRHANQSAVIVKNPRYFYPTIHNDVTTRNYRHCHVAVSTDTDDSISVQGCLPRGHYSRAASVVMPNTTRYNEILLAALFHQAAIPVRGIVTTKTAPANSYILAEHKSKPLHQLITTMLKKSDNVIAGALFKKLGQLYSKQPGSWTNGQLAVGAILKQNAGLDITQLSIVDGSGLSTQNHVTPAQLLRVLNFAFHHVGTNYEFISALPIAGRDGTLKHRLYNVAGRVRAKTGTLADDGVSTLAGYAVSRDHEAIAFVVMVNGRKGYVWKYRALEDAIATALANFSRS